MAAAATVCTPTPACSAAAVTEAARLLVRAAVADIDWAVVWSSAADEDSIDARPPTDNSNPSAVRITAAFCSAAASAFSCCCSVASRSARIMLSLNTCTAAAMAADLVASLAIRHVEMQRSFGDPAHCSRESADRPGN